MLASGFFASQSDNGVIWDGTVGSNIYSIRNINGVSQPKLMNQPMELGRNIRHNSNVSEVLCMFDMSIIPAGKTITGVDFMYNISEHHLTTTWAQLELLKQDHQIPVIIDSSSPTYYSLRHPADWAWGTILQTDTKIWGPTPGTLGWNTVTGNYSLVNLFKGWYDTPSSNNGLIMQLNCAQNDYLLLSGVKIKVYYS